MSSFKTVEILKSDFKLKELLSHEKKFLLDQETFCIAHRKINRHTRASPTSDALSLVVAKSAIAT